MTLYQVQVRTANDQTAWGITSGIDSPTFYLDSNVQGIVDEDHAERIVRDWLTDAGLKVLSVSLWRSYHEH